MQDPNFRLQGLHISVWITISSVALSNFKKHYCSQTFRSFTADTQRKPIRKTKANIKHFQKFSPFALTPVKTTFYNMIYIPEIFFSSNLRPKRGRRHCQFVLKNSGKMKTVVKPRLGSGLYDSGYTSYNDRLKGINLSVILFTVVLSYQALYTTWSRIPGVILAVRKAAEHVQLFHSSHVDWECRSSDAMLTAMQHTSVVAGDSPRTNWQGSFHSKAQKAECRILLYRKVKHNN